MDSTSILVLSHNDNDMISVPHHSHGDYDVPHHIYTTTIIIITIINMTIMIWIRTMNHHYHHHPYSPPILDGRYYVAWSVCLPWSFQHYYYYHPHYHHHPPMRLPIKYPNNMMIVPNDVDQRYVRFQFSVSLETFYLPF